MKILKGSLTHHMEEQQLGITNTVSNGLGNGGNKSWAAGRVGQGYK